MNDAVLKTGAMRQLMNELLAIEPHRRQEAVREERYRSLLLAEMLANESGQFEETCPAKAEELAELARMVADQPYPGSVFARVERVLAVSHCLQGNARRLSGDRPGAEQQFRRAAAVLTGPPDSMDLDWLEGRLAAIFGEHQEATAGLASVRRRLLAQRRLLDAAHCSLDLARLFAATGQAPRVRELIHEMHTAFPPSRDQARALFALRDFLDAVRAAQDPEKAGREALDLIRRPAAFLDKV